jgi:hypothetical protein
MNEQLEFLRQIIKRLDQAGIPYMLTGSLAMTIHAQPRMTRDIDIVVEYTPERSGALARLFDDIGVVDRESVEEAARTQGMFNVIHRDWVIKADFIARKSGRFRETEFSRRRQLEIDGMEVWVVTVEDLILSKLAWGMDASSALQTRDVRTLIASGKNLDWEYLRHWAGELGLSRHLEEAAGE